MSAFVEIVKELTAAGYVLTENGWTDQGTPEDDRPVISGTEYAELFPDLV